MPHDTRTLCEAARDLLAAWPQGDDPVTLLVPDGRDGEYFTLESWDEAPFLTVARWPDGDRTEIGDDVPGWAVDAVTRGIPLPQDGSLYGWTDCGRVTALLVFYSRRTPLPRWSVMPDADAGEAGWPPFAGERLVGPWLREHYRAGRVVDLADLIADSPGAVFWVDTCEAIGSGCIAVAGDLAGPDGWTLPRGRYVWHRHAGDAPPLEALLTDPDRTDLAPQFTQDTVAPLSREAE